MEKLKYERPTIVRHTSGLGNKLGRAHPHKVKEEIDGYPVKEIIDRYGSPVFVFSEKAIRKTFRNAVRAFTARYPKVQFAWSYKTNYLDAICRIYHQEGSWAEVVSEYEYEMAIHNDVAGRNIIYNGPYKPEAALQRAARDGAHIHIDHYDELCMIEKIAAEMGRPVNVGIRVNMDTGIYPAWDRFGFNLENGEAMNVVRRMEAAGKVKIAGVHTHIGTFVLDSFAYKNAAMKLGGLVKEIEKELGRSVEYIDLGGGFASQNTLHSQYSPGSEATPSMDRYAEAITSALLQLNFPVDRLPKLVLEMGRALVDEAGYLLTSVVGLKRLPNGVRAVIVDAGVNTLFTSFWYKHNVMLTKESEGLSEEAVIYGPLCMNIDVVRPSIALPSLDVGDPLIVHPVGAYNVTQWMQFIRMRPAVVMTGEDGVELIRHAETLDTIKHLERVPDRLNQPPDK